MAESVGANSAGESGRADERAGDPRVLKSASQATPRPVVGITTYVTDAHWGYWNLEAALIPLDYVKAVEGAGGRPMLVPPSLNGVEETLDALDAVVFTGGSDVDPQLYGAEAQAETVGIVRLRDEAELANFLTYGFAELDFLVRQTRKDLVLALFKAIMGVLQGLRIPVVVA